MLAILYLPFGYLLKFCCFLAGNYYILALLLFALIVQILMFPLSIKQQKSQIMMAKMRPKETVIREKYSGRKDRKTQEKMTLEIRELYQKEGVNQFGGCLPLLVQLPIIIALFGVIRQPLTYTVGLGNNAYDLKTLYYTTVEILEEGREAIDNYLESGAEISEEKEKKLKEQRDSFVAVQKAFGAEIDEETNTWTKELEKDFEHSNNAELELTKFIVTDTRSIIQEYLNENGINYTISNNYSQEQINDIPTFGFIGGYTFLDQPTFSLNILLIVPLLVFISSYYSSIITKKFTVQTAAANGNDMSNGFFFKWGMPLMSTYFSFTFPIAIGVYWVYRTIISVLQQIILAKMYPIPVVTEAELAEARKQIKAKKKKVIMIEVDEDDDSYNDLVVNNKNNSDNGEKKNKIEMLTADDSDEVIEKAPLKDEKTDNDEE